MSELTAFFEIMQAVSLQEQGLRTLVLTLRIVEESRFKNETVVRLEEKVPLYVLQPEKFTV